MHALDVCVADTATGEVKPLIEERLNTYIESQAAAPRRQRRRSCIFWSERDGWGHYYLYDAATGALKNRITEGEFVDRRRSRASTTRRASLYITADGREKGEDPYYTHLYRVGLDGTGMKLLDPGDASHVGDRCPSRTATSSTNSSRVDTRAGIGPLRHARQRRHQARDAGPERAQGDGLQVPRALHGEGRRRRDRPVRRDVQAVRLRPEEEVSDHRLRLSRAADRERDQDVQPAQQQHRRWRSSASS